jgi:hypothetical protein
MHFVNSFMKFKGCVLDNIDKFPVRGFKKKGDKLKMKIFKLEPKNLDSHHWNASVYNDIAIVRAKDEKHARIKAAFTFSIAVEVKSNSDATPISPWLLDDHVDCIGETDSGYPIDGDEEILYPDPSYF